MSTYPGTAGETLQTKLLGDFGRAHGILKGTKISLCIKPRSIQANIPANLACWRKRGEERHGVHLRSACAATLPEPRQYDPGRYCQRRK